MDFEVVIKAIRWLVGWLVGFYGMVGEEIHRELYKRLNFDHITKCHMHKPESVIGNKTHKILLCLEI